MALAPLTHGEIDVYHPAYHFVRAVLSTHLLPAHVPKCLRNVNMMPVLRVVLRFCLCMCWVLTTCHEWTDANYLLLTASIP